MPTSNEFVNPYTFVSLPSKVPRQPARDRDACVDANGEPLWFGSLEVTWTLHSDLQLPLRAVEEGWLNPETGQVRIPGSSAKGVLRSLHETMFNGCLRIVDDDYVPAYREVVNAGGEMNGNGWSLAMVTRSENGKATEVAVCGETIHIEIDALLREYMRRGKPDVPTTGDLIELLGSPETEARVADYGDGVTRKELRSPRVGRVGRPEPHKEVDGSYTATPQIGRYALLVTDLGARRFRAEPPSSWYWATAAVTAERVPVSAEAQDGFVAATREARDRLKLMASPEPATWQEHRVTGEVRHEKYRSGGSRLYAKRALATGYLHAGDIVWVQTVITHEGRPIVDQIKLSQVWRKLAPDDLGSRLPGYVAPQRLTSPPGGWSETVPSPLLPCGSGGDLKKLCVSCQTFGAVEPRAGRGEGNQTAISGRVRVGGLLTLPGQAPTLKQEYLAPRGRPHPGAGMFYLEHRMLDDGRASGDLPSQWGSSPDEEGTPRRLRGRKYYWHSDPDVQVEKQAKLPGPRYAYRVGQHADNQRESAPRQFVPAGTMFVQRLGVDGLSGAEVRMLLATLEPARILGQLPGGENRTYAQSLGGGKPFGLGAASARITSVNVMTGAHRYTSSTAEQVRDKFTKDEFSVMLRHGGMSRYLGQLIQILDLHGLGDDEASVAYPPGTDWAQADSKRFVESFHFFQDAGKKLAGKGRGPGQQRYQPLPKVSNDPKKPTSQRLYTGDNKGGTQ
ncbi:MAG: hypothetical protein ACK5MT_17350 [Actinomycetales bacterium]